MKASLKPPYENWPAQALKDRAYELAFVYEKSWQSCARSVVAAFSQILELHESLVKVVTSFTGGQASQSAGTCGGLIGGTLVLDYFFARPFEKMSSDNAPSDNLETMEAKEASYELYKVYVGEYGTILCPHIQTQMMGRPYYLWDPYEMSEFDRLGGFRNRCGHVVGNAARWTMEILIARGIVQSELPQPR